MKKGSHRIKKAPTVSDDYVDTVKGIIGYSFRKIVVSMLVLVVLSTPTAASRKTPTRPVPLSPVTLSEWSGVYLTNSALPLTIDVVPDGCSMPEAFQNLLNLLQTLIDVGVMFGIVLAVGGIIVSGILFLMPGVERNRQARTVFKYTLLGLIVVMVGPSVVGFIVGELNPLCG